MTPSKLVVRQLIISPLYNGFEKVQMTPRLMIKLIYMLPICNRHSWYPLRISPPEIYQNELWSFLYTASTALHFFGLQVTKA